MDQLYQLIIHKQSDTKKSHNFESIQGGSGEILTDK